jgi:hypothetical protein
MMFFVVKNGLVPKDDTAREFMRKLQPSDTVDVALLKEQDAAYRRYVFAVINRVALAVGVSGEDMRARLLVETGRCRVVKLKDKAVVVLQSMNRHSMDDAAMRSFFTDAKDTIITEIMPTLTPGDRDEISDMLNGQNLGAGA